MTSTPELIEHIPVVAVGMRFNAGPQFGFRESHVIGLVPEPQNQYDPYAVKVILLNQENRHVAYIGKRHSKQVSDILKNGVVHKVTYDKNTSAELAATLVLHCESPALAYMKRTYLSSS